MVPDFNFQSPPFDFLSVEEQAMLQAHAREVSFARDANLLAARDAVPNHVYLLRQGYVHQTDASVDGIQGPGALLGVRALLAGTGAKAAGGCQALGDVIAWQIEGEALRQLIGSNARFAAKLLSDLSRQLAESAADREGQEMFSLMSVPVRQAFVRKPVYVDGDDDLVAVCALMAERGLTNVLVRDRPAYADGSPSGERIGMFTTTDLRDALLRSEAPAAIAVKTVARFDLVTVPADAELFEAMLTMIRHRMHRVLVMDGPHLLGVLGQLDLMSFVSNHSHLIALQAEQASSVEELAGPAQQVHALIAALHAGGTRVELIARLVSELNTQIFSRLWALVAPADLVANSCLVVMGSEGRSEQILKTDQDNALVLRDGHEFPGLEATVLRFNQALTAFGYPPCPGNIMVTNPVWCKPLAAFKSGIRSWLYGGSEEGPMNMAIFMDARAVAGDASLLRQARDFALEIMTGSDAFFLRFVSAIDKFGTPGNWLERLVHSREREQAAIDLKKLGTFPIVHGVRALALLHHLPELGTVARLAALRDRGSLAPELARDLADALHFLMGLKLKNNLRQLQLGQPLDNLSGAAQLGTMDRELLKDALAIVKRFRLHLHLAFRMAS